jgi:hypothetical protein
MIWKVLWEWLFFFSVILYALITISVTVLGGRELMALLATLKKNASDGDKK